MEGLKYICEVVCKGHKYRIMADPKNVSESQIHQLFKELDGYANPCLPACDTTLTVVISGGITYINS